MQKEANKLFQDLGFDLCGNTFKYNWCKWGHILMSRTWSTFLVHLVILAQGSVKRYKEHISCYFYMLGVTVQNLQHSQQ